MLWATAETADRMSTAYAKETVNLSAAHLKMLREESGISDEVVTARGY